MTSNPIRTIRKEAGLSQTGLAAILRIKDIRTIRRWEKGEIPITGPASIILELIDADALPHKYYEAAGVKVPETKVQSVSYASRWQKYSSDENKRVSEMVETLFALPYVALADSDEDDGE